MKKHKEGEGIETREYAGFLFRLAAFAIDFLVLVLISVATAIVFTIVINLARINFDIEVISSFVGFLINAGYYVFMTYRYEATFGKKLFGLRVKSHDDEGLDIGTVIVREVAGKFLSIMSFGLGYLWIFFDNKKQGLHDKLAKTVVLVDKGSNVAKWKAFLVAGVFSVFFIWFSVWITLGVLDEDFQDGINRGNVVLLVKRTLVSAKLCVSEGNNIMNPKSNQNGGGDICDEAIGMKWPSLGGGYEYGEINNSYIFINKAEIPDTKCEIMSGECNLE
ncbi:RDD family protein [bacterium]|jgi:uncharacterized RDD family membrane protein YckC|nr:RDD family protein [bacterium]MBT4251199.1 RDD family protein [bacterium]MBT4598009.1 RDD family protein [bacterium]MBT6753578.1 RDD family protein [bacterium]MBT7037693.1 RDD family protein [bacterium]